MTRTLIDTFSKIIENALDFCTLINYNELCKDKIRR
nr:MAG TPA: hypothetical protein [Caudoviricetes sp.]DAI97154.1 MAG TPA: hypothetical protein [Caudoviricetes sp.]